MYSVLLSDYEKGIELVKTKLQNMIKNTYKAVIIPWTFPCGSGKKYKQCCGK